MTRTVAVEAGKVSTVRGRVVAQVGAGNFARNIAALFTHMGVPPSLCVDEFHAGDLDGIPVVRADQLDAPRIAGVDRFVVAMSDPRHVDAAVARLLGRGVDADRILVVADDPAIQMLRLLFERHGERLVEALVRPGHRDVPGLEVAFLGEQWRGVRDRLDPARPVAGLAYYGRGGGFRRHVMPLIPYLQGRFQLVSLSDEVAGGVGELPGRHLYMSADTAAVQARFDLVVSAHVFPCSPAGVPRITLPHTVHDLNFTTAYHAERLARSEPHYLFAASRPGLDAWLRLIDTHHLRNRLCVIPGGYPHLDHNMALAAAYAGPVDSLIYAPTLALADYPGRELASSLERGLEVVEGLLERFPGYRVIFRPHPSDLKLYEIGRRDALTGPFARLMALCQAERRCVVDSDPSDYMASYNRSAAMVSDTSSTAMTFAFATGRPAFFFTPRNHELLDAHNGDSAFLAQRSRLGGVAVSVEQLLEQLAAHLAGGPSAAADIRALRDATLFNPGTACAYLADNLDFVLSGERHADWHYFNW
jgi:hypothetical protein